MATTQVLIADRHVYERWPLTPEAWEDFKRRTEPSPEFMALAARASGSPADDTFTTDDPVTAYPWPKAGTVVTARA